MKTSLTKKQIQELKEHDSFFVGLHFNEQQIREAIEMEVEVVKGEKINWNDAARYVFLSFESFSTEFKHEIRNNMIKEIIKKEKINKKDATERVDEFIADYICHYIRSELMESDNYKRQYKLLQRIKDGQFNEFINIQSLI